MNMEICFNSALAGCPILGNGICDGDDAERGVPESHSELGDINDCTNLCLGLEGGPWEQAIFYIPEDGLTDTCSCYKACTGLIPSDVYIAADLTNC